MSKWRLCYASENVLWFTDNFENQWGDNWGDIYARDYPYYLKDGEVPENGYGHMRFIAFAAIGILTQEPDEEYCIQDINHGVAPWVYIHGVGDIYGGDSMETVGKVLTKAGVPWGELKVSK